MQYGVFHCDPGILLSLPWLEGQDERHDFLEKLEDLVRSFTGSWEFLRLVICSDHHRTLLEQFSGPLFSSNKLERNLRPKLIRYFRNRALPSHEYGASGVDSRIVDGLTNSRFVEGEPDAILAWEDFLSSSELVKENGPVPGLSDGDYGVVHGTQILVLMGGYRRRFRFFVSWDELCAELGVCGHSMLASLRVDGDPTFGWESGTGHGATRIQEKTIKRTARRSGIVVRSQTTYQNPQLGAGRSRISLTSSNSEFEFTVVDGSNVIRGIYVTKATSVAESKAALAILRLALDKTVAT